MIFFTNGMRGFFAFRRSAFVLSITIAIAAAVLWFRSGRRVDAVGYRSQLLSDGGFWLTTAASNSYELIFATARFPKQSIYNASEAGWWTSADLRVPRLLLSSSALIYDNASPRPNSIFAADLPYWLYSGHTLGGFSYVAARDRYVNYCQFNIWCFAIPHWVIVVAGLIWPMASIGQSLRARYRRRSGRCAACGYDLRASPARCPECGVTPVPVARARRANGRR